MSWCRCLVSSLVRSVDGSWGMVGGGGIRTRFVWCWMWACVRVVVLRFGRRVGFGFLVLAGLGKWILFGCG